MLICTILTDTHYLHLPAGAAKCSLPITMLTKKQGLACALLLMMSPGSSSSLSPSLNLKSIGSTFLTFFLTLPLLLPCTSTWAPSAPYIFISCHPLGRTSQSKQKLSWWMFCYTTPGWHMERMPLGISRPAMQAGSTCRESIGVLLLHTCSRKHVPCMHGDPVCGARTLGRTSST